MNKEIKYIGFYDIPGSVYKRVAALPATNKMDYICRALYRAGFHVHLISPSWLDDAVHLVDTTKRITIDIQKGKKLTLVRSFITKYKLTRNLKIVYSLLWLFFWLVKNVQKGESILAYHSPWLALPILWAKKIKKFKLILEVEEVYKDVSSLHPYFDQLEYKIFDKADAFLFSTEMLAKRIKTKMPHIIIYGNYDVIETLAQPVDDGKIHLVYAGIIDLHKAGAFNAIESAVYLNDNYVMHIIGFGQVDKLEKRIAEINKISKCKVSYDGLKSGDEYIKFCQSCHIGLSTQKMDGVYLDSSFPSKILSYLGMGLNVVSCDVLCVSESRIGNLVSYYKEDNPEAIANAIMEVNVKDKNEGKKLLLELDHQFIEGLKKIIDHV
ncbi:hypothetical protein [Pedobacter sp. Hv1]|uniref:hypothetical protein n=1 Tax=Pedobacter sp. Hv1 TaxID=1740090 RepID=UPI0006D8D424|nr:hypothetical protein [Pedobacter sp. Hv1]KQB99626.1 hypothetical protein AQF98_18930 [Pedobacter sp. Hv1]